MLNTKDLRTIVGTSFINLSTCLSPCTVVSVLIPHPFSWRVQVLTDTSVLLYPFGLFHCRSWQQLQPGSQPCWHIWLNYIWSSIHDVDDFLADFDGGSIAPIGGQIPGLIAAYHQPHHICHVGCISLVYILQLLLVLHRKGKLVYQVYIAVILFNSLWAYLRVGTPSIQFPCHVHCTKSKRLWHIWTVTSVTSWQWHELWYSFGVVMCNTLMSVFFCALCTASTE